MAMQTYETSQTVGNLTRPIMFAKGDSSDDVFTATSEYGIDTSPASFGLHEMDWSIEGGAGNDRLTASDEDDTVSGGLGNDTLYGLDGVDNLSGDQGDDQLYGGDMGDRLDGGDGNDWLSGDDGDDILLGGLGDDTLFGGAGSDTLGGGAGNDWMVGGLGHDVFVIEQSGDQAIELANEGTDTVQSFLSANTLPANIENIQLMSFANANANATGNALDNDMMGNIGANVMHGLDGNDTLDGFLGDDNLTGGNGNDFLIGGNGHDTLFGEAGADQLFGDGGDDVLVGGAGKEGLTGGAGNDLFKFNATSDSTTFAFDVIQDFVKGADKIDLSAIDANSLWAGNQAFTFNASKPFFTSPGDLWVEQGRGFSSVCVDINGDGNADMRIDVTGTMTLTASDFFV